MREMAADMAGAGHAQGVEIAGFAADYLRQNAAGVEWKAFNRWPRPVINVGLKPAYVHFGMGAGGELRPGIRAVGDTHQDEAAGCVGEAGAGFCDLVGELAVIAAPTLYLDLFRLDLIGRVEQQIRNDLAQGSNIERRLLLPTRKPDWSNGHLVANHSRTRIT